MIVIDIDGIDIRYCW